jgi:hypothetical protein
MDISGCVYVTGKSESQDNGRDYLTVKYNTLGQELWRARYDGPAHADDVPTALAVDASGNAYVTGMSIGIESNVSTYDYATVKYNSVGQQQWVARYNNVSRGTDAATAIGVDAGGNVYVTGESDHADSTISQWYLKTDFATIKYGSGGVQEWVARYDCLPYGADRATALSLDDSGNVYVVGGSNIHGTMTGWCSKVVTLKYTPDGLQQWVATIGTDTTNTEAVGISIDHSGGVCIAGHVGTQNWSHRETPMIFAAKYSASGEEQWLRFCDDAVATPCRASSLANDGFGNVVVTGLVGPDVWFRDEGSVALTLKYDPLGTLLWAREYREPGSPSPVIRLAGHGVDDAGDIYLAGSVGWGAWEPDPLIARTILAVKYDANGGMQWVQRYNGLANSNNLATAIAVAGTGTIAVAGGSGLKNCSDFVTIKYQSSGVATWDVRATGEGTSFESLMDVALDAQGNVYVTGSSLDVNTSYDYFTAKYNPEGDQIWRTIYNGPANRDDRSNAIVLDRLGNVYVTGCSEGVGTSKDWATIKYSTSGVEQWVERYNGQSNRDDEGHLIAVDSALNVYVAGATSSGSRLTTIKYDPSGLQQWTASYDSTNFVAMPGGLCVDRNGNVYVTNPQWYWADAIAFKYNSLGDEVWRVPGGNDILVGDSGNVYVSGAYPWAHTKKYDSSGAFIWLAQAGGSHIEFDQVGDIIYHNTWTIPGWSGKISRGGVFRWERGDSPADWGYGFCVDGEGNSYVSGHTYSEIPPGNYLAKLNPMGTRLWLARYLPENSILTTQACRVDVSGNVYVGGTSQRDDFSNAVTILKYGQITVSVGEEDLGLPVEFSLSQNYPNPFNPSTTIRFALPKSGHVELKIYNTLGQEVATLVNEEKVAGTYSMQWNASRVASGVYFYQLKAGEFSQTRKLLLLK